MTHVFISYAREDMDAVDQLCIVFRQHNLTYWLDRERITPGVLWRDAIRKAIATGALFIACFSTKYYERDIRFMNEELTLAIELLRKRHNDTPWFIPVLLSGDIPDLEISAGKTLKDLQYVDLRGKWNGQLQMLLDVITAYSESLTSRLPPKHREEHDRVPLPWTSVSVASLPWRHLAPHDAPPWTRSHPKSDF